MDRSTNLLIIEAGRAERHYWRELWNYRELFLFLAWRDILVRYKQMAIGLAWALLRPLLTMIIFTIVFSKIANLSSEGAPYPILVLAALLPWQFFSNAVSSAGSSVINNASMVSKIYFPRLIVPASSVIVSFVDFVISGILLLGLMILYGVTPSLRMLALPLLIVVMIFGAIGAGLWAAALSVKYPDFRILVPFLMQIGLYISPVGFSSENIPEQWRFIFSLNPMVGQIDAFRWAIMGEDTQFYLPGFLIYLTLVAVLFASGLIYFRKFERSFVDVI